MATADRRSRHFLPAAYTRPIHGFAGAGSRTDEVLAAVFLDAQPSQSATSSSCSSSPLAAALPPSSVMPPGCRSWAGLLLLSATGRTLRIVRIAPGASLGNVDSCLEVAISFIAYVATIAGQRATRRCLWGRAGQFPKRVGCAVFFDLYHSVTGLVASIFTAALRFLKSAISSMIWLMSVTSPGAHEINCLTDNMHGYYLEVLWQERFKLEVDMGKVDVREPDVGRRKECADCSRCCCETCGTTCLAILVVFFVALWFENGDVGTVVAWLADAGADKLPDS
mmetsp:Transcript_21492/g.46715  ORF Transcript_21492/g.46715 Transcript_21492/m.46715 type:complete len:281 (-) Transcript_21492:321-1163(-)